MRIMAQVKAFPAMPTTATKLLPLLDNPDVSLSKIEEIIRYDPGLTANILSLFRNSRKSPLCQAGDVSAGLEAFNATGDDPVHEFADE
jgi:c-di-GMP-related signal transduction protein